MAAALLARRLESEGVTADVTSQGVLPGGVVAAPEAAAAMAEIGIDLSGHRSRQLDQSELERADLVIGMTREHVREAVVLAPTLLERAFTLKELVRRGEETPRRPDESLQEWLAALARDRDVEDLLGASEADDVEDPMGKRLPAFRATAEELDDLAARLVRVGWGRASVHS
jgi:protein-tyrosine phosphatase